MGSAESLREFYEIAEVLLVRIVSSGTSSDTSS